MGESLPGYANSMHAGKEPGEIILQTGMSWAEDDDAALEGARVARAAPP